MNWRAKSGVTSCLIEPEGGWDVDLGGAAVGYRYLEWMAEWISVPSVKEKLLPAYLLPTYLGNLTTTYIQQRCSSKRPWTIISDQPLRACVSRRRDAASPVHGLVRLGIQTFSLSLSFYQSPRLHTHTHVHRVLSSQRLVQRSGRGLRLGQTPETGPFQRGRTRMSLGLGLHMDRHMLNR